MYYVFIAYNNKDELCNISITNNLLRRIKLLQLKVKNSDCKLVYYEEYESSKLATERENELQEMPKEFIQKLVIENNPMLITLF